jgi:hypothetical protein
MRNRHRIIGMFTMLALAAGVVAAKAEPPLAGTWVLDAAQSQRPGHERKSDRGDNAQVQPAEIKLIVAQEGAMLRVTRTKTRGTQERSFSDTLVADGSDQTHRGHRGQVVTRTGFEGDRLVVTRTHTKGDRTMSQQSVWTVSPDGRVLTIDTTWQSSRGDRTTKTVYVRS